MWYRVSILNFSPQIVDVVERNGRDMCLVTADITRQCRVSTVVAQSHQKCEQSVPVRLVRRNPFIGQTLLFRVVSLVSTLTVAPDDDNGDDGDDAAVDYGAFAGPDANVDNAAAFCCCCRPVLSGR